MAIAGFCNQCGANVHLDARWGCTRGHAWNAISDWYDTTAGQRVTPPWLTRPAPPTTAAPPTVAAPLPDPAVRLRGLVRGELERLNLMVVERDGVCAASRGSEYECAVIVDAPHGRIVFWEQLRAGRDPGVRDALRGLAGGSWTVKTVLRREGVTGTSR